MKELLQQQGWKCAACGCNNGGIDCSSRTYRGYVIKLRSTSFRIFNRGLSIASGHNYQLKEALQKHSIYKETVQ
jgi:hypothetical protein